VSSVSIQFRTYRLKARAERQDETKRRIVAATAALHEEVGPARTTIAEIARRAGVERLTVYNHFSDISKLFQACQAHFLAGHPPPDITPRGRVGALDRLEQALIDLYAWYRANEAMERNVHRDRRLVPALDALLSDTVDRHHAQAASAYSELLAASLSGRAAARSLLLLGFEFGTWERLTGDGATDAEIARLFRRAVAAVRRGRT
jgi:AcrR family transcriptional regulator